MRGDLGELITLLSKQGDISVVLQELTFVYPVFVVGLLCATTNRNIQFIPGNEKIEIRNYLSRLNFYTYLFLPSPSIRKNSSINFSPIMEITEDIQDIQIEEIRKNISIKMGLNINQEDESKAYSINFFLAELIRNIPTHAMLNNVDRKGYFMYQTYPTKGEIHIIITDSGIGIKDSFRQSKFWEEDKNTKEYIKLSFSRGTTSNPDIGAGNGLYFCRELVKITDSKLSYISGNIHYIVQGDQEEYREIDDFYWKGVLIDLQINLDNIKAEEVYDLFNGVLPGYIPEYEEIEEIFG